MTSPTPPCRTTTTWDIEPDDVVRAVFFGLGADGTVGANKNSIKIIGEETPNFAQGYFVYDSKKSGSMTISHLRFGPRPIQSRYLIKKASFVACHHFQFLEKIDVLEPCQPGATFLLNSPHGKDEVWDHLPVEIQQEIIDKQLKFYVIDARKVAGELGMQGRINTIMQTCFFALSGVLPRDEAIAEIKKTIKKTYARKGENVVAKNFAAVDQSLAHLEEVAVPDRASATFHRLPMIADEAPDFVKRVDGRDAGRQGRPAPRLGVPGRRHLAAGHRQVGEADDRRGSAHLGHEGLHPVQQVRDGLSPRGHPRQGLRARRTRRSAGHVSLHRLPRRRLQGLEIHDPGGPAGLHRLQPVRHGLPGQGQEQSQAQGDQHGAAGSGSRRRNVQLRLVPEHPRSASTADRARRGQELAVPAPLVRVLRRLCRLRRDAVPQAAHAALRRPAADRQRHRLLVHLRRQPADDPLHHQPGRPRPGLVQLAVREQRRVWPGHAAEHRQPRRAGGRSDQEARVPDRRHLRHGVARVEPGHRDRSDRAAADGWSLCENSSRASMLPEARALERSGRLPRQEERLADRRRRLGL